MFKTAAAAIWTGITATLNGVWITISAPFKALWWSAGRKATILWSYIGVAASGLWYEIDIVAPLLGDPELKERITAALAANPQYLSYVLGGIFVITLIARLRSIVVKAKD